MFRQTFAFLSAKIEWTKLTNMYKEIKVCRHMYATISFKSVVCFLKIK